MPTPRSSLVALATALLWNGQACAGGDATLLGIDANGDLYTIDTGAGQATLLHDDPDDGGGGSMAFDPVSGLLGVLSGTTEPGVLTLIDPVSGAVTFSAALTGLPPGEQKTGGIGYDGATGNFVVTFGPTGTFLENRLALVNSAAQAIQLSPDIGLGDNDGCFWDFVNERLIVHDYNANDGLPRVAEIVDPFGTPVAIPVANPPSDGTLGNSASDPATGRVFITRFVGVGGELVELAGDSYVTVGAYDTPSQIVGLAFVTGPDGCSGADLAEPFGTLDFSDVFAFLVAFGASAPEADLAEPFGVFDFSDVFAYLVAFGAGCP